MRLRQGRSPILASVARKTPENCEASLRAELTRAVLRALNDSHVPYSILGAEPGATDFSDSDLDFAVAPEYFNSVPKLLAAAADVIGAHLIQAIQHESCATYFVLAKQGGTRVGFLNPDCTTDYRRNMRLWLRSNELLAEAQDDPGGFSRPTRDKDFIYYLVKHVLKPSLTESQLRKLVWLQGGEPHLAETLRFWPPTLAARLEWALLQGDRVWLESNRETLLKELHSSPPQENLPQRAGAMMSEIARLIRRVLHPAGLFVQVSFGTREQRLELADELARAMAPAFRHAWVLSDACGGRGAIVHVISDSSENRCGICAALFRIARALIQSTLVVSASDKVKGAIPGSLEVYCSSDVGEAENLERAISAVIAFLSQRSARRLSLGGLQPPAPDNCGLAAQGCR